MTKPEISPQMRSNACRSRFHRRRCDPRCETRGDLWRFPCLSEVSGPERADKYVAAGSSLRHEAFRLWRAALWIRRLFPPARLDLVLRKTRRDLRRIPQVRRAFAEVAHEPPSRRRLSLRGAPRRGRFRTRQSAHDFRRDRWHELRGYPTRASPLRRQPRQRQRRDLRRGCTRVR